MAQFNQKTWENGQLIDAYEFNRIEQGVADSNADSSNAVTTAENAESTARNALSTAQEAKQTADSALTASGNAVTTAQQAKTASETAVTNANQAITAAQGVVNSVGTAVSDAQAAAQAANEAAARADGAAAQTVDTTLTQPGKAADAKAVGDKKADKVHTHTISDVTGLQTSLNGFITSIVDSKGNVQQKENGVVTLNISGGGSENRQVDLTNDLSGNYVLEPQTLYILPESGSVEGGMNISVSEPADGYARKWEFIFKYNGGQINFAENIDINKNTKFAANTLYLVSIVNGYAYVNQIGTPGEIALYDIEYDDAQCTDITGGWMLAPNCGPYRLYSGSAGSTAYTFDNLGIKCQNHRTSQGDGYGGGATSSEIDFAYYKSMGFTKIVLEAESPADGDTMQCYLVAGTSRTAQQITTFNAGNWSSCFGTYTASDPVLISGTRTTVELPIPDIESGYVCFVVHNSTTQNQKVSYVKRVVIK